MTARPSRNAAAADAGSPRAGTVSRRGALALGLATYLPAPALLVVLFGVAHVFYGFFDVSDLGVYQGYAASIDAGRRPFIDFPAEYPPLALRLFAFPGHPGTFEPYARAFAVLMFVALAAAAAFVADAARRLGPRRTVIVAGATFGACVAALGAIVANRFDAVVALAIAAFLWAAMSGRFIAAGLALGLGAALKLTPVVLLPLAVILAPDARRRAKALVAFGVAAAVPFVVEGQGAMRALVAVFRYHGERPLQIESVLATPLLVARVLGAGTVRIESSFGSQGLAGTGAPLLARASGPLAGALLAVVYALAWRGRARLRRRPADAALVTVGALLALLVPAKVLSPQFLVWLVPSVALLAPAAPGLAILLGAGLLLTQVEFPAMYWDLVALRPAPLVVVAARNAVLVGALAWAVIRVSRLGRAAA